MAELQPVFSHCRNVPKLRDGGAKLRKLQQLNVTGTTQTRRCSEFIAIECYSKVWVTVSTVVIGVARWM